MKLNEIELSKMDRALRMNIRNAWMAESAQRTRDEAVNRAAQHKWFEAAVLFELACDIYEECNG